MTESDLSYITEGIRALAVPIGSLKPDPANARVHGQRNLDSIRTSFEEFGQIKPIAVRRSDRVVIAGNGRLAVAQKLGWSHIAVILMDGTPAQLAAFALLDNKSAELATWDDLALSDLVREAAGGEIDLGDAGFGASELAALLDSDEPSILDEVPDAPTEPAPTPRAPDKAGPKAKPGALQQRPVAGRPAAASGAVTDEEWVVVNEAAAAVRADGEDDTLTMGQCLRVLARRYLKGRTGG